MTVPPRYNHRHRSLFGCCHRVAGGGDPPYPTPQRSAPQRRHPAGVLMSADLIAKVRQIIVLAAELLVELEKTETPDQLRQVRHLRVVSGGEGR